MGLSLAGLQSALQSAAATVANLVGQTVTALQFVSSQASGSDAFAALVNGARWHFGAGASDYASSDGTTVTFAGPIAANGVSSTNGFSATTGRFFSRNATGGLSVGIAGTAYLDVPAGTNNFNFASANINLDSLSKIDADGLLNQTMGTGVGTGIIGAFPSVQSTPVGNVGAGEDDLMTYTLPANSLTSTNNGIRYSWSGAVANDVNAKTLKIYFGTSVIQSNVIPISVAGHWFTEATIVRTGLNAQRYSVITTVTNTATNAVSGVFTAQGTITETETATIVLKATATATADNDLTQTVSVIEYF